MKQEGIWQSTMQHTVGASTIEVCKLDILPYLLLIRVHTSVWLFVVSKFETCMHLVVVIVQ